MSIWVTAIVIIYGIAFKPLFRRFFLHPTPPSTKYYDKVPTFLDL